MSQTNQICDGYNPKALMGNWYEQSFAVQQPVRINPTKIPRDIDFDISFKDKYGNLTPLNRISRLQPWNTEGLVQLSNKNAKKKGTQMKQRYDIETIRNYHKVWNCRLYQKENQHIPHTNKSYVQLNKTKNHFQIFNSHNVNELINQRENDQTSFKSTMKPNIHVDQKKLLQTTYQRDYETNKNKNEDYNKFNETNYQSGLNFKRVRSQITLKNIPLIKTFK